MLKPPLKLPSCPFCWDQKHKCHRHSTTLVCRGCSSYFIEGRDPYHLEEQSKILYQEVARAELHKTLLQYSLSSLDVIVPSFKYDQTLSLQLVSSTGSMTPATVLHKKGTFDTRNHELVARLDALVQDACTESLRGKEGSSQTIHNSVLAGGYINLLSSTVSARGVEQVTTMINGASCANELSRHGLHAHIRFLVFCRLEELLHGCLNGIRCQNLSENSPKENLDIFAAATILRYELVYFRRSLRNGPLSELDHLPPLFKRIIVSWFAELETELTQYLRLGCGQYIGWQDVIGPKKTSRRSDETFSLNISLDINKFTICGKLPPATKFTNPAGGDIFLMSPHQSPLLQALAMSYDMPDGIEQLPSHVATPTSVMIVSDLCPDLQFLLRASDEDEDEILTDLS